MPALGLKHVEKAMADTSACRLFFVARASRLLHLVAPSAGAFPLLYIRHTSVGEVTR